MLGLGIMGAAMARRLASQGFTVRGWNRSPDKAVDLVAHGVRLYPTPAQAAGEADIVAVCLTDAAAVEAVLFGVAGAVQRLGHHAVVVDFSTIGVEPARRIARRLENDHGLGYVDAPVSGGPSAADQGALAVLCGGAASHLARAEPVIAALARVHTHLGPSGSGQAAKLCNQLIVSSAMMAIAEAISVGRALGLDVEVLPAALAGGYADSLPLQIFGPRMARGRLEPRISEVATMLKDVRALHVAVEGAGLDLRLARATLDLYEDAAHRGLAHQDLAALPQLSAPATALAAAP
jgi:3-hydroxyisobutyrate dehydrogenase-like beta-hydroxyacid dehydrogenase